MIQTLFIDALSICECLMCLKVASLMLRFRWTLLHKVVDIIVTRKEKKKFSLSEVPHLVVRNCTRRFQEVANLHPRPELPPKWFE